MEYISSLTVCLQSSTIAVVEAYESVSTVIETLEAVSTSVDRYHDQWCEDAVKLADSVGVTPKCPGDAIHKFIGKIYYQIP